MKVLKTVPIFCTDTIRAGLSRTTRPTVRLNIPPLRSGPTGSSAPAGSRRQPPVNEGNIHVDDAPSNHSRVESVGAKFYAAWLGDKGQYIDSVLSVNRYHNKLSAKNIDESISTADYHNYGLGLSVEIGHCLEFTQTSKLGSWFIDPQVQLSYFRANGASFHFSNDMKVRVKSTDSLNGRLGIDLGKLPQQRRKTVRTSLFKRWCQTRFLRKDIYPNE